MTQIFVDMEEWRKIDGFNYEVSSIGRVRRIISIPNCACSLKLKTDKDGYQIAALYKDGKRFDRKVHRLVCTAVNGPPESLDLEARHLDGVPSNNVPTNLKWGTAKQNADDRNRHGTTVRGETHSRALFSDSVVKKMRYQYNSEKIKAVRAGRKYVPRGFIQQLAQEHHVDRAILHRILSGAGY